MKTISLSLLCVLVPLALAHKKRVLSELFELSDTCSPLYVNVDDYDEVDIKSMERRGRRPSVQAGASCKAYFKTVLEGHGLCVRMQGVLISSENVTLEIQTGPYGPDRSFQVNSAWKGNWCFPHNLIVMTVRTAAYEENVHRAAIYSFAVTNVSLEDIPKHYYMDSFVECGMSHTLSSGQEVTIVGERDPKVIDSVPQECQINLETTSSGEYEQVCVEMRVLTPYVDQLTAGDKEVQGLGQAARALSIQGLNTRFYNYDMAVRGAMVCSENKQLVLNLTRNDTVPFNFRVTVTSQWHPEWEAEASEASELRGLRVVKGITYFIATIDSLVAIFAAGLAFILRKPAGPWRQWVIEFNAQSSAHAPQPYPVEDPAGYGSMHVSKDGNFSELPLEGATPTNEVLVEAHTY